MPVIQGLAYKLCIALGIGLLIGAERERRKGEGPSRSFAGIRTFAIASLLGGLGATLGGELLLAMTTAGVAALVAVGYLRSAERDPGLTTEITLLLTVLLGGFAMREPATASGLAVAVAIVLVARARIHHFVRDVLSQEELTDGLIFAAATLVVLPLAPDRYVGPFSAINPRIIWKIVILIMAISASGYIAIRLLGPRVGLPLTGLGSGFVSSAATIAAMGARAAQEPLLLRPAVAGAVLSTVATVIELTAVLAAISRPTLSMLTISLVFAGLAAAAYAALFTFKIHRQRGPRSTQPGRAFNMKTALLFASTIAVVLWATAAFNAWLGRAGLLAVTTVAGFADTHSPAVSVASLVAAGKLGPRDAVIPILAGFTANTVTKVVLSFSSGKKRFAFQVVPGLILVLLSAWGGAIWSLSR